jgi:hypothetical protein
MPAAAVDPSSAPAKLLPERGAVRQDRLGNSLPDICWERRAPRGMVLRSDGPSVAGERRAGVTPAGPAGHRPRGASPSVSGETSRTPTSAVTRRRSSTAPRKRKFDCQPTRRTFLRSLGIISLGPPRAPLARRPFFAHGTPPCENVGRKRTAQSRAAAEDGSVQGRRNPDHPLILPWAALFAGACNGRGFLLRGCFR